ncbi:hypothetical protein, partial [Paenibacillus lignilyticus]|uniref:hypothetical protein n=1 Tax=Paenibacillus lignilyticus TaxID=1172615 RepID=UPI001F0A19FF
MDAADAALALGAGEKLDAADAAVALGAGEAACALGAGGALDAADAAVALGAGGAPVVSAHAAVVLGVPWMSWSQSQLLPFVWHASQFL